MEDFLRAVTSDFERIAISTGFRFSEYSESVDWENLESITVTDIVKNVDVNSLSRLVASVLSYNIEKMSVSKKILRLSQLIIDFLLHCKRHSTFKVVGKIDSMVLCELCGKMYTDVNFLKYHYFRRHTFNSCTYMNSPEDNRIESLKLEVLQLQNQLKKAKSNYQNNLQTSNTLVEKQNVYDCYDVHKNKLSYNLIFQQGDNPMQTQEMFWQQKYDNLEKNYINLKNECELNLKNIKITSDFHRQCDFFKTDKSSKYVQTEYQIEKNTTPKCPPRNIDVVIHQNKEVYITNTPNTIKTDFGCQRHNGGGSSDKDVYELKKPRLEAQHNISKNNTIDDSYEPLLPCDYGDSFTIGIELGNMSLGDELFKNMPLLDLIKFDVKELINQRLEEYYLFKDSDLEKDTLLKKISCENAIFKNYEKRQDISPDLDCDKVSVKQNKTFKSRLKKKISRFSRVFTSEPNIFVLQDFM